MLKINYHENISNRWSGISLVHIQLYRSLNMVIKVVIIDDLSNSSLDVLDGIASITGSKPEFHEIDVRDPQALSHFFQEQIRILKDVFILLPLKP